MAAPAQPSPSPASSLTSPKLNLVLAKMPKPTRRQSHSTPPIPYSRRVDNPRRSSHRSASPRRQRGPVKQTRFRVPSDDSHNAYGTPRDRYYLPGDDSDNDHVSRRGRTPQRSQPGTAHSPPPSSASSRSASSKTRYPRGHSPPSVSSRSSRTSSPPQSPRILAGRGRSAESHHARREASHSDRARSHDPRRDRDRDRGRDRNRDKDGDRDRDKDGDRDRDINSAGSRPRDRDRERDRDKERDSARSGRRRHSPYPRQRTHRSPSPSRSRSRSRSRTKHPSASTIVREATHHALEAGALAALSLRHDPSPWLGKKGGQVAAAAIGAAVVDTFVSQRTPNRKGGLRHSVAKKAAQMVVGGLAVSAASGGAGKAGGGRAKGRR